MAALPNRVTGYIETPGGPRCGNCRYLHRKAIGHPEPDNYCPIVRKAVDARDGCCTWWDDGSRMEGIFYPPARLSLLDHILTGKRAPDRP
jgi:hypothetical protein